jgi:Mg-chelatase subunit ChlD
MASPSRIRWRLVLGYAVVASLTAALGYASQHFAPRGAAWLAAQGVELAQPAALWLCALVPWFAFTALHSLAGLPFLQQLLSMLLRATIVCLLAFVLAEPVVVHKDAVPASLAVVVDTSASITDEALATSRLWVSEVLAAAGDTQVSVLGFAAQPRRLDVAAAAGGGPTLDRPEGAAAQHSDLQAALRQALAALPEGTTRRIVLVTDGMETRGNVQAEVERLRRLGVPVFAKSAAALEPPAEVWVRGLSLPSELEPRVPFTALAELESTRAGAASCVLRIDGVETATVEVQVPAGRATARFEGQTVPRGGEKKITVECKAVAPLEDRFAENNTFETVAHFPEKPRVLYVEGSIGESADLAGALGGEMRVEVRGPGGLPSTVAELSAFDAVVVSDLPRVSKSNRENFSGAAMQAVRDYVEKGGVFVMAGGPNSLGPGGYTGTALERSVLPVKLDVEQKNEEASVALMLVIDKSGSMSGLKMELAKEAAKATARALKSDDLIGVVAFDARPEAVVKLGRAANSVFILNNLSRLQSGGGTSIRPALEEAGKQLRGAKAQTKHIILLTDGQSDRSGVVPLAERLFREGVTVSTVAIGDGSDAVLLREIALAAGGNSYRTQDPNQIKKIFLNEASQLTRKSIVEERFTPRVSGRAGRLQALRGLGAVPPLLGYVSTKAKGDAEVLMTTHRGEPLLARQRIGLGWSIVWTSDAKARWALPWVRSSVFPRFWRQLLRSSMPVDKEMLYAVEASVGRETLVIEADAVDEADAFVNGLRASARVRTPLGDTREVDLQQTASGRYTAELPLEGYGAYAVEAAFSDPETGEQLATGRASATAPYPDELALTGRSNTALLEALTAGTEGAMDPSTETLVAPSGVFTERRSPAFGDLLLWALGMLVGDVLLRRVRLWRAGEAVWRG